MPIDLSVPFTVNRPAANSRSASRRFQHMAGDPHPFAMISFDAPSITMLPSRSARPECEPPPTETRAVSPCYQRNALDRHAEPLADKLGETGFVSLATGHSADDDLHHSFGQHGDLGPLARHTGRGVHVIGDADAATLAAPLGLLSACHEPGPIAECRARAPSPGDRRRCRTPCRTDCDMASRIPAPGCAAAARCDRSHIDAPRDRSAAPSRTSPLAVRSCGRAASVRCWSASRKHGNARPARDRCWS